jgi:hypothetical protein
MFGPLEHQRALRFGGAAAVLPHSPGFVACGFALRRIGLR